MRAEYTAACPACGADAHWVVNYAEIFNKDQPVPHYSIRCRPCETGDEK